MFVLLKKIVHFSMWDQILIFDFAFGLVQDEPIKPFNTELPLPDPLLLLRIKNGVLVFSGAATGDITKAVREHREDRLKKISLSK